MTQRAFIYNVYGLTLESELELPQLLLAKVPADQMKSDKVTIQIGEVPDRGIPSPDTPDVCRTTRFEDDCLVRVAFVGDFLVTADRIIVQKQETASWDELRAYLVGTVLATVVHFRGLVPLHVSAVLSPAGAVAFTGESGAGKSTIAAHLHRELGWPLISDDVSILSKGSDAFLLESGVRTVKLWKDALASLDRSTDGLKRDLQRYDKFHAIDPEKFVNGRHPLRMLVHLEWGDQYRLEPVFGAEAFKLALGAVYRPKLMTMCGNVRNVADMAMSLASVVTVQRLMRQQGATAKDGVLASLNSLGVIEQLSAMS